MSDTLRSILTRFSSGEGTTPSEVVRAFRSSSLYVALAEAPVETDGVVTNAKFYCGTEQETQVAYGFSSIELLAAWCVVRELPQHAIELVGEELCRVLPERVGICLDSWSSNCICIPYDAVATIKDGDEVTHVRLVKIEFVTAPILASSKDAVLVEPYKPPNMLAPATAEKPAAGNKPPPPFAARANRTQFFAVPQSVNRPKPGMLSQKNKSQPNSSLKKVIRPPSGGKEE
jgi:hypothetical protein